MKRIYTQNAILACLLLLCASLPFSVQAQLSFTNESSLLTESDHHSGVAIAVLDMNDDNLDDIVRLSDGKMLNVEFQNEDGTFTSLTYGDVANQSQWTICAADVNNDGFGDVMCGDYNETKIITAINGGTDFDLGLMPGPNFFAQGSNFADINNDGWLDAFVCDDNAESRIFGNNGDGTFSMADDWIDMATTPESDNSGNYGSIWTDFDNDGDLDLYIAKCRQGVSDVADPRRINALFVNDNYESYSENALEYGVKIGWQSWTADFQDIDNDGDMDMFLTNHDFSNQLFENDGSGYFTEITNSSGMSVTNFPLQGVMRDFDNDGYVDIFISGGSAHMMMNNGDNTFTELTGLFDGSDIHSYAIGDLNHDGFLDIYASYANGYTTPNPDKEDILWMNDGNDNNFFAVNLVGVESNRDAIGARVEIYGPWGVQIREVRAGESYGIMNSTTQHFGLGTDDMIETLIIKWPSGNTDVIQSPDVNTFLTVVEGGCGGDQVALEVNGDLELCPGESVTITAPEGYDSYDWNVEGTSNTLTVSEPGLYFVLIDDGGGCTLLSESIQVTEVEETIPEVAVDGELLFCAGGSVELTAPDADEYSWSVTNETSQTITVTEPGDYFVTIPGVCGDVSSEPIAVEVETADVPVVNDIQVAPGENVTISATGTGELYWYEDATGGTAISQGPSLDVNNVNETTSYWVENHETVELEEEYVGKTEHQGSNYSGNIWNIGTVFDAFEPFVLKSVLVYSDTEAERIIELQDASGAVLQSLTILIPETGEEGMRIDLNFDVPVGTDLVLGTNTQQNVTQMGFNSPRLQRSDANVNYDEYFIDGVVDITSSTENTTRYYYFFDWEIQQEGFVCISDRVEAQILVVGTENIEQSDAVSVYPNPTSGELFLNLDLQAEQVDVIISDLAGKQVARHDLGTVNGQLVHEMNVGQLAKGIYLISVATPDKTYNGRFVVQ